MKKIVLTALGVCLAAAFLVSVAGARRVQNEVRHFAKPAAPAKTPVEGVSRSLNSTAAATTTYLASHTWNTGATCTPQNWVSHDLTAPDADYVHVDDFAGLGGGNYGLLNPLAGGKSMWIGARANGADPVLCGYASLPGYGNSWHQLLCSTCYNGLVGDVTISYLASWDSEPGYDQTTAEYDAGCAGTYAAEGSINGGAGVYDDQQGSTAESFTIPAATHGGSVSFRFNFEADGAWSDSDGLWNTDGAFIIDNLVVEDDNGVLTSHTFEGDAVGAHQSVDGRWHSCNLPGYGDYAALMPGAALIQEDLCDSDLSCLWTFFTGSTVFYSCGGFPGQRAVPYHNTDGQYLANEVWSPNIPWVGTGSEAILQFDVYRDLPLDNLVFYVWHVRSIVNGCPQGWVDDNTSYYGDELDWLPAIYSFGQYIDPQATHIQIAVGAADMCFVWCGQYGSGACHSHAPLIDNLTVKRVAVNGPQWAVSGWQHFQDNFAADGTVTGTVRIDMASDINLPANPNIQPGDSAAAVVIDPVSGLKTDPISGSGPAVYAYVTVSPVQAAKTGAPLTDDPSRWPVVGSSVIGGKTWTIVRFDTSFVQNNQTPVPDTYCIDLNDTLLVPGDMLEYFYCAESNDGSKSYYFSGFRLYDDFDASGAVVTTTDINVAAANAAEITCLPDHALNDGGDILYVDDGSGRVVQPYFDQAFQQLGILDKVDRFDVWAPSSNVSNSLDSRVTDIFQQIIPYYKKILWNSEELEDGTIGDGTGSPEKSDDFALLYTFLDNSTQGPGLYISGDGIPGDWDGSASLSAINLRSVYLSFNVVTTDHKTVGLGINPLGIGVTGGCFAHTAGPDTMVVYGGCFGINEFDVLAPTGSAVTEMRFNGNPAHAAAISQITTNASNAEARVMMEGFSFDLIRDDRAGANGGIMDRVHHLYDVITWLQNILGEPTDAPPSPRANALAQNYPNPFNPQTTIAFAIKDRGAVSVKVYNVAGQLVRTLVNEDRTAGAHTVVWDGRNDSGSPVSSGVYFYKLVASDFSQTKKMVLLK
jgi:hypothetical protein